MSVRHLLAGAAAALIGEFEVATPAAAHVLAQSGGVDAFILTPGRLLGTVGALVALAGVVVGGLALARPAGRTGNGNGKRGAVVALVAGFAGMVIGGLVVAAAEGGPGTGYGIVGGFAALVIGLIATVLGWLALAPHPADRLTAVTACVPVCLTTASPSVSAPYAPRQPHDNVAALVADAAAACGGDEQRAGRRAGSAVAVGSYRGYEQRKKSKRRGSVVGYKTMLAVGLAAATLVVFVVVIAMGGALRAGLAPWPGIAVAVLAIAAFALSRERRSFLVAGLLAASGLVGVVYGLIRTEFLMASSFPGPIFGIILGLPILGLAVAEALGANQARRSDE